MKIRKIMALFLVCIILALSGCTSGSQDKSGDDTGLNTKKGKITLNIVSGSENKELAPLLESFVKKEKIDLNIEYKGSLDIMRSLQSGASEYDGVWPASSLWLTLGDTEHKVKHIESVSITPVVFGVRESLAKSLGFTEKEVKVADIIEATRSGKLKFCMTSATQSNSGASAYLAFLSAIAGNPQVLTKEMVEDPQLQSEVTALLAGVDRSSGSSEWLKELFLKGDYDAMVNYESLIITTNEALEAEGKEPLHVVYLEDGLSIADSPLGYVDHGDKAKEEAFLKLQEYLLSEDIQAKISDLGRRTGYGTTSTITDRWGVQPSRILSPMKMPAPEVINLSLELYQTQFRKPSFTVYVLDYSDSMKDDGWEELQQAMETILIQDNAKKYLLQAEKNEVNHLILFSSDIKAQVQATGNQDIESLYQTVEASPFAGGTRMYVALEEAVSILNNTDLSGYNPAIIVMTDGMSQMNRDKDFIEAYQKMNKDIPIFSIMFGEADESQLEELAQLSYGRVFDGRKDLIGAFRSVKGYN